MSITQNDFKKIWASTSSVPEYTFSDADYQNGWEFVGELPPTRAMWDTLQRKNDQKMKYLQDNGSMCFDSVADMVSTDLETGQTVLTKGYHSVNDGGSALYTIRTKDVADVYDGGSIIFLDNGNVAELITDGTVSVYQFGITDSATSDVWATQMAAMITFIQAHKYIITGHDLTLKDDVSFRACDVRFTGKIDLNGHDMELGSVGFVSPRVYYEHYFDAVDGDGDVYVRGAAFYTLTINDCNKIVKFRTNANLDGMAFSTYHFNFIFGIEFDSDDDVTFTSQWANDNYFFLNDISQFITKDVVTFGHNFIHGGDFEGAYKIEINRGSDNRFVHSRLEGNANISTITFGMHASNNIIESYSGFFVNYTDNGLNNVIRNPMLSGAKLLYYKNITVSDIDPDELYNGFVLADGGTSFKIGGLDGSVAYETPFLENPQRQCVVIDLSLLVDGPMRVAYSLYDKDMNLVPDIYIKMGSKASFFLMPTYYWYVANQGEGQYMIQNAGESTCRYSNGTLSGHGNYIFIKPTSYWSDTNQYDATNLALLKSVKYIKWKFRNSQYDGTNVTRFLNISLKVLDMRFNYRREGF